MYRDGEFLVIRVFLKLSAPLKTRFPRYGAPSQPTAFKAGEFTTLPLSGIGNPQIHHGEFGINNPVLAYRDDEVLMIRLSQGSLHVGDRHLYGMASSCLFRLRVEKFTTVNFL